MQSDAELIERLAEVMPDLLTPNARLGIRDGWFMRGDYFIDEQPQGPMVAWIAAHAKAALRNLGWTWCDPDDIQHDGSMGHKIQTVWLTHPLGCQWWREFYCDDPVDESRAVILCCLDALEGER